MKSNKTNKKASLWKSIDWLTIFIYLVLLALGWMSVCGACYDFDQTAGILDFSTRSGMQIVWIDTSLLLAFLILMTDDRIFESLSYIIYIGFLALLFVTPFIAHDIKGSLSWIKIGSFSVQPAEFAKFGVALCLAKVMSTYGFDVRKLKDFIICAILIAVPMGLIVMQKETGSALVYSAFFLMLYREGMPGCLLFTAISAVAYFVIGIRYAEVPLWGMEQMSLGHALVMLLIQVFTTGLIKVYGGEKKNCWSRVLLFSLLVDACAILFAKYIHPCNAVWAMVAACGFTTVYLLYLSLRDRALPYLLIALFTLGSMGFFYSADFVLNKVMEPHQQTRIRVLLGLEDDPRGAGYNVIQAKIAIGSGGLEGKGFLNGTQTKLKYVPEQDTDFIFCTVGEEEGFIGCAVVLLLFLSLILRLLHLAERQPYTYGRVYGYCVLSIFLFHVFINVGMVLGLTPVIGIPLPFFSYGGSSLWGFTILLFVFLRIDAGRNRFQR
ncbi:MAG: rod shape-determining protein RodA [Bacteroidaceae bacterium]|nr:rod shape-determining protein RodA [Bacteroidaceae bacterium]MBQ9169948.1 rod shape-determining protein RodA [Bacteroidaceae bacterium]MBQ9294901.1 rod shape-determining protein RodA [Bacteroidaceae bacterium]